MLKSAGLWDAELHHEHPPAHALLLQCHVHHWVHCHPFCHWQTSPDSDLQLKMDMYNDANHIAQPCRLDRLKPLKRSRSVLPFSTCSGPVRDCIFNQVPRNPLILLHHDHLLSSMFFRMYVSHVFGLLIKTVHPPVLTDELACDSSIACIKDLYCAP
jgi:hypothetical protein